MVWKTIEHRSACDKEDHAMKQSQDNKRILRLELGQKCEAFCQLCTKEEFDLIMKNSY